MSQWNLGFANNLAYGIIIRLINKYVSLNLSEYRAAAGMLYLSIIAVESDILGVCVTTSFLSMIGTVNLSWYTFLLNLLGPQTHCLISLMALFPL